MKRFISTLLIIIGIILIFSPIFNRQIIKHTVTTTQEVVQTVTAEDIEENLKQTAIYDFSAIKDVGVASTITGSINFNDKNVIGQLTIPDLNINLPILKGVTNSNLLAGASTMVDGIEMGMGNYPLAGHYMKEKGLLFGGLIDIEVGSKVKITDKKVIYEYEIYDTQIVPDTSFYMLDNDRAVKRGKPIISLMTCYYTSKNGKRFFALGELVNQYSYETGLIE